MLKPDPSSKRQISADGPILLWRDAREGGREVLALSVSACANDECACRDVIIEGWRFGEELRAVTLEGESIKFFRKAGSPALAGSVLYASIDVDTETIVVSDDGPAPQPWAMEWFRRELDSELLAIFRKRFAEAKLPQAPTPDWRKQDWSWWRPGMDAAGSTSTSRMRSSRSRSAARSTPSPTSIASSRTAPVTRSAST
jgi:hypothetical protein